MFDTKNKWVLFGLIILSIIINIYFRISNTMFFSPADKIIKNEIYNGINTTILQRVSSFSPGLSDPVKKKIADKLFRGYLRENKEQIRYDIDIKSKEIKACYQDEKGWTYLLENDSFRWFRRIESYLNTGQFGSRHLDNQEYDDLEFAPWGDKIEPIKLFYYSGAYFYKFLHMINNKLSLMNCLSLFPVVLSPVLVLAVFWICGLFGISYWGSFLVSLLFCLSPEALRRTSFGWFDTDIYNLFMPVIITSVLACAFRKNNLKSRILIIAAGILLGVYSAIWSSWWIFFYILFISIFIYELNVIINDRQRNYSAKVRQAILEIFLFIFSVYLSVLLISGWNIVKRAFCEPILLLSLINSAAIDNFWPNLKFSIVELIPADLNTIITYVGGKAVFYGGIIGLLLVSITARGKIYFKKRGFLRLSLFVWLSAACLLALSARRFILFLILPLGVFFCAGLDIVFRFINQKQSLFGLNNNKKYGLSLICVFLLITGILLNNARQKNPLFSFPLYNDTWQNMLMKIKKYTPAQAIIDIDWVRADFVMSAAKRATIIDAHYQYNPVFFWFDYALLTDNEEEAFGIIQMINSGGGMAYEKVLKILNSDKLAALEVIKKMAVLKEEESRLLLSKYTQDKYAIGEVLKYMYGNLRPAYLIVHNRMLNEISAVSKIGNWDFRRNDLWQKFGGFKGNNLKRDFTEYARVKLGYPMDEIDKLYAVFTFMDRAEILDWISRGQYVFYSGYSEQSFSDSDKGTILLNNGIVIDRDNLKAYFYDTSKSKWIIAGQFILAKGKEIIKENINQQGDAEYSMLFMEEDNAFKAFLFSRPLARSIFFKLYFLNGKGLKHFKLINREYSEVSATDIYLYEIIK